ncbi:bifunctional 3-(3-hydroxy-phenyl)propionate/3-hydroxycinnamic acid hydroxylase [Nocardioides flavescens]|uniref:Bifunctional 3-(3-hydroxy-phenyl)propionate/3-hydroxycinnamic acid hydroxylase n=1 Tax=Nocardioides flavescens TaxID=2691959 RepID=A0A6L7F002_9ACTN|nr:bifunctional 3-(3-hydroxy-phenyl)propionate/3-hydroxycinnamic acid hydroxylase [Nocardioides flavescens]MXG89292.1 bifunctional 3-(3-hydroxy-phenyl)propionate/3-hydroxycinnamic acid hydroxylase [Nocardioides flavescens]
MQEHEYDVVVVGFGPGGEVLAATLGRAGHRVLAVEKASNLYGLPRMTTLDGELARVLTNLCDGEHALRNAMPLTEFRMVGADGQPSPAIDWRGDRGGFPAHMAMHQPDIEEALAERIASYDNVDVRWSTQATDFRQTGDGVEVTVEPRTGEGEQQVVTARYLVGFDGSSSGVREALGIEREVLRQHEDWWVLTDFDVVQPLPDGFDEAIGTMDPRRPHFFGLAGVGRCRSDVKVMPGEVLEEEKTEERALQLMEEHHGIPRDHLRMTRQVAYKFRSEMAHRYRVGNVLIGGDAAHSMTPFMGQGACCAMRDGINLGWKLSAVLSGAADETLLDTYEEERVPHAAFFVHGSLATWAALEEPDPEKAAARDHALRAGLVPPPPPFPGVVGGVTRRAADDAVAGALAPQGRVRRDGQEGTFDEVTRPVFALVSSVPLDDVLTDERRDFLSSVGCVVAVVGEGGDVEDLDGVYGRYLDEHGIVAFLTRPDFYQFGSARGADEVGQVVDDLQVALAPSRSRSVELV